MPRFNFTFQEASPLITYIGLWMEGSPANDTLANEYNGSFRVTNSSGAKARFDFDGTGATIFGGKRPNHGNIQVNLDNGVNTASSLDDPGNQFQVALWQSYGLPYEGHTVEVTNEILSPTKPYFDLDFVSLERTIGQDKDTIYNLTIEDSSPLIHYGRGPWQPSTTESQRSNSKTTTNGSQLTVDFQGSSIELYGLYANAEYQVGVDGGTMTEMRGLDIDLDPSIWHPQTLLYLVDGLVEDDDHSLILTTTQTSEQRPFLFDYAIIRSTRNLTENELVTLNNAPGHKASTPLGLILGVSLGAAFLCLAMTTFIILRRRRARAAHAWKQVELYVPRGSGSSERLPLEHPPIPGPLPEPYTVPRHTRERRSVPKLAPPTFESLSLDSDWLQTSSDEPTVSSSNPSGADSRNNANHKTSTSTSTAQVRSTTHNREQGSSEGGSLRTAGIPLRRARAEDAGAVPDNVSEHSILPPAYNPDWNQRR